jgi:hypothetical protein
VGQYSMQIVGQDSVQTNTKRVLRLKTERGARLNDTASVMPNVACCYRSLSLERHGDLLQQLQSGFHLRLAASSRGKRAVFLIWCDDQPDCSQPSN